VSEKQKHDKRDAGDKKEGGLDHLHINTRFILKKRIDEAAGLEGQGRYGGPGE
jgi:hypothetical protein